MTDQWTSRLSEYVDGELPDEQRAQVDRHLAECAGCRATVEELRRVIARAHGLEPRAPATDLWPGIAERIGSVRTAEVVDLEARRQRRRLTVSIPQLAAAAVALMLMSAGAGAVWLSTPRTSSDVQREPLPTTAAGSGIVLASAAESTYESAVHDLERVLAEGRGRLDTATVRVLEQNLSIIDSAIAECRRALAADPASPYLNEHLSATMMQKLELLRRAARLATAAS